MANRLFAPRVLDRLADHRKRLERWCKELPKNTSNRVDEVLARIAQESNLVLRRRHLIRVLRARSRRANCLVLYGAPGARGDLEGWYRYILSWFEGLGFPADKIAIGGEGYPEGPKQCSFDDGQRKLKTTGFRGLTSIELQSSIPAATFDSMGWRVAATANVDYSLWMLAYDDDIKGFDR